MSISSTGLYGSATIVNSDLFTDVETLKELLIIAPFFSFSPCNHFINKQIIFFFFSTIVNSDLFTDVETLEEQVTTLSTTYLQTTEEHRTDISQNRQDISLNLSKINDISNNRIVAIETDITDISNNRIV